MSQRNRSSASTLSCQPLAFVVGCPRSGTTLLLRMLDAHSQLAVANDTHFIPRVLERHRPWEIASIRAGTSLSLDAQLVEAALKYHRSARLGLSQTVWQAAASSSRFYSEFVSQLYAAYAEMHNKKFAIEKTPDYVRHIPLLHALFPHAKFIHIIRDGRDVALSLRDWAHDSKGPGKFDRWKVDPISVSALWWEWMVTQGRVEGSQLSQKQYLEVSYEALVARPNAVLKTISKFLEVPYESKMRKYHRGKLREGEGLSAKHAWLPPTQGLRSWRSEMSQDERMRFEALAGPSLSEFGYDLESFDANTEVKKLADDFRSWWESFLSQRSDRFNSRCGREDINPAEAVSYAI